MGKEEDRGGLTSGRGGAGGACTSQPARPAHSRSGVSTLGPLHWRWLSPTLGQNTVSKQCAPEWAAAVL